MKSIARPCLACSPALSEVRSTAVFLRGLLMPGQALPLSGMHFISFVVVMMILSRSAVTTRAFLARTRPCRSNLVNSLLTSSNSGSTKRCTSSSTTTSSSQDASPMENLYKEWTLQEDETLWRFRNESIDQLASRLGRGLRGVEARMTKLKNVESAAYQRLFVERNAALVGTKEEKDETPKKKEKLLPAGEVVRRIKWDYQLDEKDFSILHYDRQEDRIIESPFTAQNSRIAGSETQLVDALPEHRIKGIKYKERIVWDREERLDLVFGPPGIAKIMEGYEVWWQRWQDGMELNRRRQAEVALRLERALGPQIFAALKDLSTSLTASSKEMRIISKKEVEEYVEKAQDLFRNVRADPSMSTDPTLIPLNDYMSLDMLSELVALMPEEATRASVLIEISTAMRIAEGKKVEIPKNREVAQISEEDLTETFVRGSGPGGQKINKTSNRVVLVHNPTQLRVEVQESRSLHENRKIARKRLRVKVDEFLYGKQSKRGVAAEKAASKKAKAKARSKARQRRKQQDKESE